jgi:uncharacterized membrane protein
MKAAKAGSAPSALSKWGRLGIALAIGVVLFLGAPRLLSPVARALLGWDAAVFTLMGLVLAMMARGTASAMRRRAALQDSGRWVILIVTVGGALFSLLALAVVEKILKNAAGGATALYIPLMIATIILSWLLVHTQFALHYAHGYYGPSDDEDDEDGLVGGLEFPSEPEPDYWDFMYFSFVVGMTCQVSDVQISGRMLRRLALIHGVIAFFFNTIILALTINVVAGVM